MLRAHNQMKAGKKKDVTKKKKKKGSFEANAPERISKNQMECITVAVPEKEPKEGCTKVPHF